MGDALTFRDAGGVERLVAAFWRGEFESEDGEGSQVYFLACPDDCEDADGAFVGPDGSRRKGEPSAWTRRAVFRRLSMLDWLPSIVSQNAPRKGLPSGLDLVPWSHWPDEARQFFGGMLIDRMDFLAWRDQWLTARKINVDAVTRPPSQCPHTGRKALAVWAALRPPNATMTVSDLCAATGASRRYVRDLLRRWKVGVLPPRPCAGA